MKNIDIKTLPKVRGEYIFNEPMKKHTWLNVGGNAEVLFYPQDVDDLRFFMQNKSAEWPIFVLGGGSNILVRDGGISGITIKLKNQNFAQIKIGSNTLVCGCGLQNHTLKKFLPEHNIGGLEFICSIPGTLGGMIPSNAGCFGKEIKDVLVSAKVMDGKGNIFEVFPDEFHFAYRHSNFPKDWILLELELKYFPQDAQKTAQLIAENDEYRRTHQPQNIRTAGSTFKNPQGYRAWELVKNAGGESLKIGGACFSPQHYNFLLNDGTALAEDIEQLTLQIMDNVKKQNGITLEMEIKIVGNKKE